MVTLVITFHCLQASSAFIQRTPHQRQNEPDQDKPVGLRRAFIAARVLAYDLALASNVVLFYWYDLPRRVVTKHASLPTMWLSYYAVFIVKTILRSKLAK